MNYMNCTRITAPCFDIPSSRLSASHRYIDTDIPSEGHTLLYI